MHVRARTIGSLAIALFLTPTGPSAQAIPPQSLEDQVLGWIKVYNHPPATQAVTADGRVYSAAQLSIARLFANWMQASYLPKAALGDVALMRNEKLGPYNQNMAALPQSYGAVASLYMFLKYDANKKIVPQTSDRAVWTLEANGFYGVPADGISTPEHYYFTLPSFEQQGYGTELEKAADVSRHPVLGQFPAYFLRNSSTGNRKYILLSKDHRLPFVAVTKGEYLDALEVAIGRKRAAELKRITEAAQGNQKEIDRAMKDVDDRTARRTAALAQNRVKYRARLRETAEIYTDQPDVMLENAADVFERESAPMRLPVYTIDPRLAALCKTDVPQWIVMSWTAQLNDPVSRNLHDAVINNVNFQYIYDYFFDPDKVKGQPYKPLRSPSFVETTAVAKASETATKNAVDPSVHFSDDFSSSAVGKKPLNWKSSLDNTGSTSVVTELNGLTGHWASISGFTLTPLQMKPLPADFELSYDVVAGQNYTWGAHGMILKLAKTAGGRQSFLSVRIRPGFGGRQGEVVIEGEFPGAAGYITGSKFVGAPGFSNDAAINRATVTLKKKSELLQVFIGKTKVAEFEKGVPASLQFDALSFELSNVSAADRMFIGNVRIAKN